MLAYPSLRRGCLIYAENFSVVVAEAIVFIGHARHRRDEVQSRHA
jgi:hypothetical protein